MSQATSYEIRIVNDQEFDMLPYKKVKESLGLADAKRGVAYIRQTGIKDVDQNTIEHEFDELLQKVSPHEEDGIRYKSGVFGSRSNSFLNKAFRPLLAALSFTPLAPIAIPASLALTTSDIATRGFRPLDLLSFAGPALGAFKGAQAGGGLSGAFKGAVGLGGKAANAAGKGVDVGKLHSAVDRGVTTATNDSLARSLSGGRDVGRFGGAIASGIEKGSAASAARAAGTADRVSTLSRALPRVIDTFKSGAGKLGGQLATQAITSSLAPSGQQPLTNTSNRSFGSTPFSGQGNPGALDRFSPNLSSAKIEPGKFITEDDVLGAFQNIDVNSALQKRNAQQSFRGQSREGNSSFNTVLNNIASSNALEREQFVKEADATNTSQHSKAVRADIMKLNNLSDKQFDELVLEAKKPNAPANYKEVFSLFI